MPAGQPPVLSFALQILQPDPGHVFVRVRIHLSTSCNCCQPFKGYYNHYSDEAGYELEWDDAMADRQEAPGFLGLIQAFVNTVDLEDGTEQLKDPNTFGAWLVAHGLMVARQPATDLDLKHAVAVREAIRGVIGANSGARVYPLDVATLNGAAAAGRLRARFGADGRARLEPEAAGIEAALGRIVAAVFAGMGEEEWTRLKLCGSTSCRWVYYDQSKNHSSRWCKMASCGNRQKARRFRERSKPTVTTN
jgi:predicted RNA-binding Zn ribbon-like protein